MTIMRNLRVTFSTNVYAYIACLMLVMGYKADRNIGDGLSLWAHFCGAIFGGYIAGRGMLGAWGSPHPIERQSPGQQLVYAAILAEIVCAPGTILAALNASDGVTIAAGVPSPWVFSASLEFLAVVIGLLVQFRYPLSRERRGRFANGILTETLILWGGLELIQWVLGHYSRAALGGFYLHFWWLPMFLMFLVAIVLWGSRDRCLGDTGEV